MLLSAVPPRQKKRNGALPNFELIVREVLRSIDSRPDMGHLQVIGRPNAAPGFMTQDDIRKQIRRSKSWMYENHIVPIYDDEGTHVNRDKTPRFPWEQLPPPCVRFGKTLWLQAEIDAWGERLGARKRQQEHAFVGSPKARRKVMP